MKQDKYIGLGITVFAAFMFYDASKLPPPIFGGLSAAFVPQVWFVLLGISGIWLALSGLLKDAGEKASQEKKAAAPTSEKPEFWRHYRIVAFGFAAFFGYILGMSFFGYLIATLVFLPVLMWILGPKTKKSLVVIAATTLGVSFGIHFVFYSLLNVFLPEGSLF